MRDGELGYTIAESYGVIAAIITWNAPLMSIAMKVPAAVAAGNTVVIKPSELTPFSGELFMDLVDQAGFPPGVINLLPGTAEAGNRLVTCDLVKKITFTGGLPTATKILTACAASAKPVLLELGGKSANIVLEDADVESACAFNTALSVGVFAGQGCGFADAHAGARIDLRRGRGKGPLTCQHYQDRWSERSHNGECSGYQSGGCRPDHGDDRASHCRRRHAGGRGKRMDWPGYYIEPTVFTDVDSSSELAQNEVFGPVLAITKFATDEEAIANGTRYGLDSYIQTNDITRALRIASELDASEVLVNGAANVPVHRPFGGFGISGVGKEGGCAGFEEFLRVKSVAIAVR
jgi:aldehyde dehydrogenase (NAD+)